MKASEFKKLIREEVRRVLSEATSKYKVGQQVDDLNGDEPFKVVKVYPNKAAALADLKKTTTPKQFKNIMDDVESMYDNYRPISQKDDARPWYVLQSTESDDYNEVPYLNPEAYVFPAEDEEEAPTKPIKLSPDKTYMITIHANGVNPPMAAYKNDPKAIANEFKTEDGHTIKKIDNDTYLHFDPKMKYTFGIVGKITSNPELWQALSKGDEMGARKVALKLKQVAK